MKRIPIPSWEANQLDTLGNQGKLHGISPQILAGIDLAESSGTGGYANSSGYGGWFGLSQSDINGYGGNVGLTSTSQNAFDQQAEVAATIFANLLAQHNGSVSAAEMAYQGGSHEGVNIFHQYGITDQGGFGMGGGGTGTLPSQHHNSQSAQQASATTSGSSSNTMQEIIFNDLQNSRPGALTDLGPINPLNWVSTAIDWSFAQIIPLLLAAVFVLIALMLIWHEIGRTGAGKGIEDFMKAGMFDAAKAAAV